MVENILVTLLTPEKEEQSIFDLLRELKAMMQKS